MRLPNDYFAADSAYREVSRFLQFERTPRTMDEYLARLDLLRRKVESKMQMGGASPKTVASVLCMQMASHYRSEKSLASAGPEG